MSIRASGQWLLLLTAGSIVACESVLAPNTDVGLRVWAEVAPEAISIRDSLSPLIIRVLIRNSSDDTIKVISGGPPYGFTQDPSEGQGVYASFRIACADKPFNCGPNTDWWGNSVYVFAPRTTYVSEKSITPKKWREGGWPLVPQTYRVRSWFNGREGETALLRVRP